VGYRYVKIQGRQLLEHRLIWALVHGTWPQRIDHINGIRDDNRLANLRAATAAENAWNEPLRHTNTSGVKGVHQRKDGRFVAQHRIGGRVKHVGIFWSLEEAAKAVQASRERYHAEFANHG
jgi:hypothetical protein